MELAIQAAQLKLGFKKPPENEEIDTETKSKIEILEAVNYYLSHTLPLITRTILRKKYVVTSKKNKFFFTNLFYKRFMGDRDLKILCIKFIKDTLLLICEWIYLDETILLTLLTEIMDEDAKFYDIMHGMNYRGYSFHQQNVSKNKQKKKNKKIY